MQSSNDRSWIGGSSLIFLLMFAVIVCVAGCRTASTAKVVGTHAYTEAMYRNALENQSTSPSYVLITLRENEAERLVCIPAPFLLGAIHMENHLDYNEQARAKAFDIALKQPRRNFSFSESQALRNVQPRYTPEILEKVRALLESKSDSELWAEAGRSGGWLHEIYRSKPPVSEAAYRDAVAHVLLNRGILVGIADIPGSLYLAH